MPFLVNPCYYCMPGVIRQPKQQSFSVLCMCALSYFYFFSRKGRRLLSKCQPGFLWRMFSSRTDCYSSASLEEKLVLVVINASTYFEYGGIYSGEGSFGVNVYLVQGTRGCRYLSGLLCGIVKIAVGKGGPNDACYNVGQAVFGHFFVTGTDGTKASQLSNDSSSQYRS